MKFEKHKNLKEESEFYWNEISDGTFEFDGREHEVLNCVYIIFGIEFVSLLLS